jgi:pyruvate dehydrogenase E1 component alpha subunit
VLFCQNNGWAISVPLEEQAAAPLVERAAGYGIPGVRVDGNDALAVWQVTKEAAERARWGQGPTFIEGVTYRMGPHLTNDEPSRYRGRDEVERWAAFDPIVRLRAFLLSEAIVTEEDLAALELTANDFANRVRAGVVTTPRPPVEELFEVVAEGTNPALLRQQREISDA